MPFPPAADAALQALAHVALVATAKKSIPIVLVPQYDSAVGWGAAAVHPMQALETQYQAIVRDAERRGIAEPPPLAEFYFLDAAAPRLLGAERDRLYRGLRFPLPADAMRHAKAELRAAGELADAVGAPDLLQTRIADTRLAAMRVCHLFMPPGNPAAVYPPSIVQAFQLINALGKARTVLDNITLALTLLQTALAGDASVQMLYSIEPFYLSRLLVRYRVRADALVSKDDAMTASGALTDVLNRQPWLTEWLARAMIDLEFAIGEVDPHNHTRFFLKGGRALAYLNGDPQAGSSDWDTQVLINPELSPADWYTLYRDVSNAILLTLVRMKNEFYSLLSLNAALVAAIPVPLQPDPPSLYHDDGLEPPWAGLDEAPDPPAAYEPAFLYPCKAELIDVGMPRRDTLELREQWAQLHNGIIRPTQGMPIPGYAYYVEEYIMMIREFFAGMSSAKAKAGKRIERLAQLMAGPHVDGVVLTAMQHVPMDIWIRVVGPLNDFVATMPGVAQQPARYALIVLLDQLATAHAMVVEPALAEKFGTFYAEWMVNGEALAPYPPGFRFALPVNADGMADAIGFGGWMAERLTVHARLRAALIARHRADIDLFIRTIYDASIFTQRDDYEVQFAIGGSMAATLQAEYHDVATALIEPVSTVTLGLYYEGGQISEATAIALLAPLVRAYVGAPLNGLFYLDEETPGVLKLYWTEPQTLEPFDAYHPLAIEIVARRMRERPLLSVVWGLPVLGLRDLIVEYQQRAAHIVEFTRRDQLRKTAQALTEMLMKARA